MVNNRKILLTVVVLLQFLLILFLSIMIFSVHRRKTILGAVSVNPISRDNLQFSVEESLSEFYEPKAGLMEEFNKLNNKNISYQINQDTLHETKDYSITKPAGTYRIVTLGDSFTFGLYLQANDNWAEQLERILNDQKNSCEGQINFEVINLGVIGYDIQFAQERFLRRGVKYSPDLVLWLLKGDDVMYMNEVMSESVRNYREQIEKTGEDNTLTKENDFAAKEWEMAIKDTLKKYNLEMLFNMQKQYIAKVADSTKGEVILLVLPHTIDKLKKVLMDSAKENMSVNYYDQLIDIYDNDDLYFRNDGHPTAKGHKQIAEDVFKYLRDERIIPCHGN